MNKLDKQYQDLLQDILDNGVTKKDRTGTGIISVFGRQIRHKMSDGFPLLTTKKMAWKTMVTELIWFLRGDTNIKYLVDNGCNIWNGDCYQAYVKKHKHAIRTEGDRSELAIQSLERQLIYTQEDFINKCKTDSEFSANWGLKIEERELSESERVQIYYKKHNMGRVGNKITKFILDNDNIPTRLITITYKNEKIESYES